MRQNEVNVLNAEKAYGAERQAIVSLIFTKVETRLDNELGRHVRLSRTLHGVSKLLVTSAGVESGLGGAGKNEIGYRVKSKKRGRSKMYSANIEFQTADQAERIVTHRLCGLVPNGPFEHNCYKISKIVEFGKNVTVHCNRLYVHLATARRLCWGGRI